ncbi:unnamed protein product [Blepharisma stoltei]|uniref:Uncharacterized protein n=1 Tax=Blepharisma stoltei TaxID=1481888 RepID=A0AAU9ISC8_9CILI|nr:unnamed protein product [Blepharisma stoltei]
MYRDILKNCSYEELERNKLRFEMIIQDLLQSLSSAYEENDELKATNSMLKSSIEFMKSEKSLVACSQTLGFERSSVRSLSTQSTEINETIEDDIEESAASAIKVFPSSPNKLHFHSSSSVQGAFTPIIFKKSKRLINNKSYESSEIPSEKAKTKRVSVIISEDIPLPSHYYKTMSMKNSLSLPYAPKKSLRPYK